MATLKTGKEVQILGEISVQGKPHYIVDLGTAKFVAEGVLSRYVVVSKSQFIQNVEFIKPVTD